MGFTENPTDTGAVIADNAMALTSEAEPHIRFVVNGKEIYSLPQDEYTRRLVRLLKQAAQPAEEE